MSSSTRIILALSLQLSAAGAFIACGGEDEKTPTDETMGEATGEEITDPSALKLAFNPMFSAFEPGHTYQVPVIVQGFTGDQIDQWIAEPADAVTIEKTGEGAMITMLRAGEVTITARKGNLGGSAPLTITEATADLYMIGEARYNQDTGSLVEIDPEAADEAMPGSGFDINEDTSCTNCHGETSTLNVRHTPQQTAGYSDAELISIFTEAKKPEWAKMNTDFPPFIWRAVHTWNMTEEQKMGIVVYLRSLQPKVGNSEVDFFGAVREAIGDAGFPGRPGQGNDDDDETDETDEPDETVDDAGADDVVTPDMMDAGV